MYKITLYLINIQIRLKTYKKQDEQII